MNLINFLQLKICSKKVFDIWMERVTFHDAPSLFWKNSLDTNRKKEFLKKLLFFIFKKVLKLNFAHVLYEEKKSTKIKFQLI
jgi:hypothetical protein